MQFVKDDLKWRIGRILESNLDMAYHLGRLQDREMQRQFLATSLELKTSDTLESLQYRLFELTNRGKFDSLSLADFGIEIAREIKDQTHLGRIMIRRSAAVAANLDAVPARRQLFQLYYKSMESRF